MSSIPRSKFMVSHAIRHGHCALEYVKCTAPDCQKMKIHYTRDNTELCSVLCRRDLCIALKKQDHLFFDCPYNTLDIFESYQFVYFDNCLHKYIDYKFTNNFTQRQRNKWVKQCYQEYQETLNYIKLAIIKFIKQLYTIMPPHELLTKMHLNNPDFDMANVSTYLEKCKHTLNIIVHIMYNTLRQTLQTVLDEFTSIHKISLDNYVLCSKINLCESPKSNETIFFPQCGYKRNRSNF